MRNNIKRCLQITVLYIIIFVSVNYLIGVISFGNENKEDTLTSPTNKLKRFLDLKNTAIPLLSQQINNTKNESMALSYKHEGVLYKKPIHIKDFKENGVLVPIAGSVSWMNDTSRPVQVQDLFISVKTTKKYHVDRVSLIIDTWWIFARDQTFFFSDEEDSELYEKTRGHLVQTNCTSSHTRTSLCCKMSVEYDHFIISNKRWWCHADDDTYLNIPALVELLQKYNHTEDWYLGRPSLNHPLQIPNFEHPQAPKLSFWFATGGAGFCISRPLALKMMSHTGGGRLKSTCGKIRLPDDCTIGYIVEYVAKGKLTVIREFHSHLEPQWMLKEADLAKTLSVSYIFNDKRKQWNVPTVRGFPENEDHTRFRSIHCRLFPYLEQCPKTIFGSS